MRISDWSSDVCSSDLASFPAHITAIAISACLTKFALFLADVVPVTGKLPILGHGHSGQSSGRHQGGNDNLAHNSIPFAQWANPTKEIGLPTSAIFDDSSLTARECDCQLYESLCRKMYQGATGHPSSKAGGNRRRGRLYEARFTNRRAERKSVVTGKRG